MSTVKSQMRKPLRRDKALQSIQGDKYNIVIFFFVRNRILIKRYGQISLNVDAFFCCQESRSIASSKHQEAPHLQGKVRPSTMRVRCSLGSLTQAHELLQKMHNDHGTAAGAAAAFTTGCATSTSEAALASYSACMALRCNNVCSRDNYIL